MEGTQRRRWRIGGLILLAAIALSFMAKPLALYFAPMGIPSVTQGLALFFPLYGNLKDYSENNVSLSYRWDRSFYNGGIRLSGEKLDFLQLEANSFKIPPNQDQTVSLWVRMPKLDRYQPVFWSGNRDNPQQPIQALEINSMNQRIRYTVGGATRDFPFETSLQHFPVHLVASVSFKNNRSRVYVSGKLLLEAPFKMENPGAVNQFLLGRWDSLEPSFKGNLGNFSFWDRELSMEEAALIFLDQQNFQERWNLRYRVILGTLYLIAVILFYGAFRLYQNQGFFNRFLN
ncbi:MAG: hypothetical protein A2527_02050 [Candidatus Lambdaproteobacteria bacterium RIFOXYD2_FULL_50_16]|uniref:Uncharacterized protein n=1 Tax=Candidatus Lambdaproteobacteria bacterium RIFOXYD2_FULL_50_16 TaxID=1817772 RepID=A0A1F6GE31_9PROT|nr:MAG: hypothetical protein A2527_02050 [Candidatus Lambdaproteobacteria bacterium RIFOXYD2_FULL_50_16]